MSKKKIETLKLPKNLRSQEIYEFVRENYETYGEYVNLHRGFCHVVDGLKPVYRRVLLASKDMPDLTKTPKIVAQTLEKYHPHGDKSASDVASKLVRVGIFNAQGNHGAELLTKDSPAAMRYTYCGLKKEYKDYYFNLLKHCPGEINEEDTWEPHFLATPVPYALVYGSVFDVGVGAGGRIPAFTFESIVAAYQDNSPYKLKTKYNNIVHADYKSLWETGTGKVHTAMDIVEEYSKEDDQVVIIMRGPEGGIVPDMTKFDEWMDNGWLWYRDESDLEVGIKVVIGRTARTRSISDDDIYKQATEVGSFSRRYNIILNVFGKLKKVGIKDWLDISFGNYEATLEEYKTAQTADLREKLVEFKWIPEVGKMVMDQKTNEEIISKLKIDSELTNKIVGKPIRMLRKTDFSSEIESTENKINEIESINAIDKIKEFKINLKFKR